MLCTGMLSGEVSKSIFRILSGVFLYHVGGVFCMVIRAFLVKFTFINLIYHLGQKVDGTHYDSGVHSRMS